MKNISEIRNKIKRSELVSKMKAEKNQEKLKRRMKLRREELAAPELKEERLKENIPATIENMRRFDDSLVAINDEEVVKEEACDEFSNYFTAGKEPKIFVTTSRRPSANAYAFGEEFTSLFPDGKFIKRSSKVTVQEICKSALDEKYTCVCIINEDRKKANAITLINLPEGPTLQFKLTSVKLAKDIRRHGKMTPHTPEIILNNFNTRLGHTVGRMFASMFPHVPEFKGRQAVTFHNQRDFIFIRRHRYIFNDEGDRCNLQEIGPRFTLKLQSVQNGLFDPNNADYEWIRKPDQDGRKQFFL